MGFSNQERINLVTKALAAGVLDANEAAVWYETLFPFAFTLGADKVWTQLDAIRSNPAANLAAAQANAAGALAGIVEDLSDPVDAVRLTQVPGTNQKTYAAYSTFGDVSSSVLDNWVQPQQSPQASGTPSNGYSIRLFNGDPNAGGVEILTTDGTTGTGANKTVGWIWNYANGLLLLSVDFFTETGISPGTVDFYVSGFRYIGTTAGGALTVQDEGSTVTTANTFNFEGAGVEATDGGGGLVDITVNQPTFIYQPGGTQIGNVFTDFGDLVTAFNAQGQPGVIRLDDTFSGAILTVPAGSYDFAQSVTIIAPIVRGTLLRFESGATITGVAEWQGIIIDCRSGGPLITPTPSQIGMNLRDCYVQRGNASSSFFDLPTGQFFRMRFINTDFDPNDQLVNVNTGASWIPSLIESSIINSNNVTGGGTVNVEVGPDSRYNPTHSSFTGTLNVTYLEPTQAAIISKTSGSGALLERGTYQYDLAADDTQALPLTSVSTGPLVLINNGPGTLTLDPNGAETINGAATFDVVAGQTATVRSDKSGAWKVFLSGTVPAGITGDHPALREPGSPNDLADFMESGYRPYNNDPSLGSDLYVTTTGSDSTGDGSIGNPFATIGKAVQLVGQTNEATVRINLGAGTFDLPGLIDGYNWIDILGTESDGDIATQSGAAVQADEEALILDVTGLTTTAVDELTGTLIEWTSGAGSLIGRRGWIRHNDITGTTGGGITRVTVTQDDPTTLRVPLDTNTFKLVNLDSTVRLTEFFHVFQNSVQCNFRNLVMTDTGGGTLVAFSVNTDKIGVQHVRLNVGRVQVGRGGGWEFNNSYLAATGNSNRGMLSVRRNGDCQILRGSVIDGDLNATVDANRFVEIENGGKLSYDGNCVFRGLNTSGIRSDGAGIASSGDLGSHFSFVFDDCDAGFVINSRTSGLSGWYQLPNLHGTVASTYAVTAQECACVALGSTSNITAGSGVNAVSADGGVSNVATFWDSTIITGGSPEGQGFPSRFTYPSSTVTTNHTALLWQRVTFDPTGGTFTVSAPPSASAGDQWAVKNVSADVTGVTIDGNGSNIEDPTSSFSLAASFTLSGDGISVVWEYDGTQWLVV